MDEYSVRPTDSGKGRLLYEGDECVAPFPFHPALAEHIAYLLNAEKEGLLFDTRFALASDVSDRAETWPP